MYFATFSQYYTLKKKHVAIAYHKTWESAAAGIVHPIKIKSEHTFADILTKALDGIKRLNLRKMIMLDD